MNEQAQWMYDFLRRFGVTTREELEKFSAADLGHAIDPEKVAADINAEREPDGETVRVRRFRKEGMDFRRHGKAAAGMDFRLEPCRPCLAQSKALWVIQRMHEPYDWDAAMEGMRLHHGYWKGQTLQALDARGLVDRKRNTVPEPVWRAFCQWYAEENPRQPLPAGFYRTPAKECLK